MLIGVGARPARRASSAAGSMRFIMRVCDVMLSFPSILIALLIAGVGRALFPNAHDSLAFGVLIVAIALHRLGAVRAHGARLDDGRAQQGIRAGRARHRRLAAAHHAAPRAAQRAWGRCWCWRRSRSRPRSSPRRRCRSSASACRRPRRRSARFISEGNKLPVLAATGGSRSFPGAMLVLIALSVNLLGDWLRDALNPRLR